MTRPPLRWQLALTVIALLGVASTIVIALLPSSHIRNHLSNGAPLIAVAIAAVWIIGSQKLIQLKRERRVWALIGFSLGALLIGHLVHFLRGFASHTVLSPSWSDLAFATSYVLLWAALLMRSGKFPHDRLGRCILWCDVAVIVWSAYLMAYHLVPSMSGQIAGLSLNDKLIWIGYPCTLLLTLIVIAIMLYRAVPRPLQGPRGLLVLGVILVLGGQMGATFCTMYGLGTFAVVLHMTEAIGALCYGVSALWESAFYSQRTIRSQVIDPFPSLFSLLVPVILVVITLVQAVIGSSSGDHSAVSGLSRVYLICLIILGVLVIVRLVLSFLYHLHLYRTLQHMYAEMAQHAATDPLTNLANHRFFMERLHKEMRRSTRYQRPLALIFCDLDHFKKINDTYGHIVGDIALREMADCLHREVRDTDLVARYGGEEFVVLLPETTLEQAVLLAERLREALEELIIPQKTGTPIRLTMSCGVSSYPDICDTVDSLLATADHAMYEAKHSGRNRVVSAQPTSASPLPQKAAR